MESVCGHPEILRPAAPSPRPSASLPVHRGTSPEVSDVSPNAIFSEVPRDFTPDVKPPDEGFRA